MTTLTGLSGSDALSGTSDSDKLNAGAGDDTMTYNVTDNLGDTRDVYTGGAGIDTVLLEMSYAQWMTYQSEISRYITHLETVKRNMQDEVSNGSSSDFTFEFVSDTSTSTLTVQMMEKLRVVVDVKGDGQYVEQDLIDDEVDAEDDTATFDDGTITIYVLANDSVPDLVKTVAFADPNLAILTLTYGTARLEKQDAGNASTWYFTYSVDAVDDDYIALAADVQGTDSFTYIVTDADGSKGTATVTITVTGVNDAATISGATVDGDANFEGAVTEAGSGNNGGIPTATGSLFVEDPDADESTFQAVMDMASIEGYGTYSISAEGVWTYTLNNDNADVEVLTAASTALTDSFKVHSVDGTEAMVLITITGADDVVPPLPKEDVLWVTSNTEVTLSTDILLKNDPDGLSGHLTVTGFDISDVTLNTDEGTFKFTSGEGGTVANPKVSGFYYFVMDSRTEQELMVSVYVNTVGVSTTEANTVDLASKIYDGAYLAGGSGVDTFTAGNGDTVMVAGENDVIFGGAGIDTIIGSSWFSSFDLPFAVENFRAAGIPAETISVPFDVIRGNGLNNTLSGSDYPSSIYGGEGNDMLYGMDGGDFLLGEAGDDQLFGGAGDDQLFDFFGKNTLTGGAGSDQFYLSTKNINTVVDFSRGEADKIRLQSEEFEGSKALFTFSSSDLGKTATLGEFFYNSTTGQLFFGAVLGSVQIGLIGESEHPDLIRTDFFTAGFNF